MGRTADKLLMVHNQRNIRYISLLNLYLAFEKQWKRFTVRQMKKGFSEKHRKKLINLMLAVSLMLPVLLTACRTKDDPGSGFDTSITDTESSSAIAGIGFQRSTVNTTVDLINENGMTVQERIQVPEGFVRIEADAGSFGEYLRNLPLKPHGSKVKYYDGRTKPRDVHAAVLDIDVGNRDLQQCADAVMRLWAEYLYGKGLYDEIHFNFTNGFKADYATWRQGNRIKVEGNNAYWVKQAEPSNDYESFRRYLDMVFAYAGTLSLSQEMKKVPLAEMRIGDVFLKGEDPGHCVIVLDMAENKDTGEKIFIVAQSYMPAQDIHILKNPAEDEGNPWYSLDFGETLITPEWKFTKDQLVRFED
ncbi:DUF4846 domain-containing protein [Clostridium thermosuccinogenes]|uniref:DUF4846 domain-containing protein n=1 Tax=Clostridium thermosuccinogenes TaxID=84032 RepID=UPI001FA92DA5|nr:DUF4846 domain-containing protein [Pseudoclostridium thermosuccinogenes]